MMTDLGKIIYYLTQKWIYRKHETFLGVESY